MFKSHFCMHFIDITYFLSYAWAACDVVGRDLPFSEGASEEEIVVSLCNTGAIFYLIWHLDLTLFDAEIKIEIMLLLGC